METTGNN